MEIDKKQIINDKEEELEIEENNLEFSSDEDKDNKTSNNKKGIKLHTIKSKIKVINYAKDHNISAASREFNIPRTTINDWVKNQNIILNIEKDKYDKKNLNKGASSLYEKEEKEIINFIEFNLKLFNPITTISLLIKFLELVPDRKKNHINPIIDINVEY